MELEIWVGDMGYEDHDRREAYRRGLLQFSDLLFLTVDVPNAQFLLAQEEDWRDEPIGLSVDAAPEGYNDYSKAGWPNEPLPEGAFSCSFVFVGRTNSYFHVAAHSAVLLWLTEPRSIYAPP